MLEGFYRTFCWTKIDTPLQTRWFINIFGLFYVVVLCSLKTNRPEVCPNSHSVWVGTTFDEEQTWKPLKKVCMNVCSMNAIWMNFIPPFTNPLTWHYGIVRRPFGCTLQNLCWISRPSEHFWPIVLWKLLIWTYYAFQVLFFTDYIVGK